MSNNLEQLCPLCDRSATYEIFQSPYCKHFTCDTCVEFCIDSSSEDHVKDAPSEYRSELSVAASTAGHGRMFVMRKPTAKEANAGPNNKQLMVGETIVLER